MIFLSAGHNTKGPKTDPGATGNGYREADLTIKARNAVAEKLDRMGVKYITDKDEETLGQYLSRIKTGSGSVVLEFHFDASSSSASNGCTSIVGEDADRLDKAFGREVVDTNSRILGVKNRGVISEKDSHRGRLGLMREQGIVCLLEIGFVTNLNDIVSFNRNLECWSMAMALLLKKYEDIV